MFVVSSKLKRGTSVSQSVNIGKTDSMNMHTLFEKKIIIKLNNCIGDFQLNTTRSLIHGNKIYRQLKQLCENTWGKKINVHIYCFSLSVRQTKYLFGMIGTLQTSYWVGFLIRIR